MKTTVLHIIDALNRGGAEKLLVNVVNALDTDFENIVLYFSSPHDLRSEIKTAKIICLDIPFSVSKLPKIVSGIRKVIEQNNVSIVHSHSYWTNIAVRFVRTKKLTVIQSYHSAVYDTMWKSNIVKLLALIDKVTYRKSIKLIAVSDYVKSILERKLKYKNVKVLRNFVENPGIFNKECENYTLGEKLKIISVGNIKKEKNHDLVVEAFYRDLKDKNVKFDIFGTGTELEKYRNDLKEKGITNLQFKGQTSTVYEEMSKYNLFCMTSFSEACPLTPLEAMKVKLPMLLSDIPGFKEIAGENAVYFQSNNSDDLSDKINNIINGKIKLEVNTYLSDKILSQYSKVVYMNKLKDLYKKFGK